MPHNYKNKMRTLRLHTEQPQQEIKSRGGTGMDKRDLTTI